MDLHLGEVKLVVLVASFDGVAVRRLDRAEDRRVSLGSGKLGWQQRLHRQGGVEHQGRGDSML